MTNMIGLMNLGNTCYINSCIQILNNINEVEIILKKYKNKLKKDNDDDIITNEFLDLIELKYKSNKDKMAIISPNKFIYNVKNISKKKNLSFYSNNEGDVVEFLFFIIECFNNSLNENISKNNKNTISTKIDIENKDFLKNNIRYINKKIEEYNYNDKSEITELFYGSYLSFIESFNTSEILSLNFQTFMILDLCLINDKNITIYDCFDFFTKKELLNSDNLFYNEKTKNYEKVYKYNKLWSLPNILLVVFNRFDNYNNKINHIVDSPIENVDFNKYVHSEDNKYIYDLTGIIYHYGNCNSGHYTCVIKKNNIFYEINDQYVSIAKNIINDKIYSFVYTKK